MSEMFAHAMYGFMHALPDATAERDSHGLDSSDEGFPVDCPDNTLPGPPSQAFRAAMIRWLRPESQDPGGAGDRYPHTFAQYTTYAEHAGFVSATASAAPAVTTPTGACIRCAMHPPKQVVVPDRLLGLPVVFGAAKATASKAAYVKFVSSSQRTVTLVVQADAAFLDTVGVMSATARVQGLPDLSSRPFVLFEGFHLGDVSTSDFDTVQPLPLLGHHAHTWSRVVMRDAGTLSFWWARVSCFPKRTSMVVLLFFFVPPLAAGSLLIFSDSASPQAYATLLQAVVRNAASKCVWLLTRLCVPNS